MTNRKVAIITGGATGIGRSVALRMANEGVAIVLAGRNKERGEAAMAELASTGSDILFVQTDVSKEQDVQHLVSLTFNTFGRIDYLFNNAGTEGTLGPLEVNTEAVIDEVLSSNIKGVVLCIKHILPIMTKQGSGTIINTASFVGTTMPLPVAVVYGASKAAVLSITRSVAASCAEHNVQVYAVCPWVTDTPMADRLTGFQPEAKAAFGGNINPSGKIALADDIAGVVASLFSGQGNAASGEAVLVDYGGAVSKIVPMSIS